jgi:hypothetical protein
MQRERHAGEPAAAHDDEALAVGAEAEPRPLRPQPLERRRELVRQRLLERTVAGARTPHRVADADRLVVAHVPHRPLVLAERTQAEVEADVEQARVGTEVAAVSRVDERLPHERLDLAERQRALLAASRGDAPVDEHDVAVQCHLDADERVGIARDRERHEALRDRVREPVGVPRAHGLGKAQSFAHRSLPPLPRSGSSTTVRAIGSRSFRHPPGVSRTRRSSRLRATAASDASASPT